MTASSRSNSPAHGASTRGAVWAGALLVLALGACSSTPLDAPPSTPSATTPGSASATTQPPSSGAQAGTAGQGAGAASTALPPYADPSNPLSRERSVYFGFDEYTVSREAAPILERHGNYLASQANLAIRIEGNTDARGGAEYNLALGQRRAEAVRQALRIYGVKDAQMETISWGSERPRAEGSNEEAWAQNRRVDLTYPRP